jgi:pilus assembly protein CpaB
MKPKTLILTVVAVTCGLGASYMTSQLLANREQEQVEKVSVLVAKRNINMGDIIKDPVALFEMKEYVKDQEPKDAIREFEQLKGRQLKIPRRAGDSIRVDDLISSTDPAAFFSAHLPTGYRAVGLRVDLQGSVAGFATLPLSRVDIVNTVRRGEGRGSYSNFLLENVLVLGIDGATQRDESGKAMPGNIVTFALSPEDVLKLNLARDMGSLTLALRKMNDNGKIGSGSEVTGVDLRGPGRNEVASEEGSEVASNGSSGATSNSALSSLPSTPPPALDPTKVSPAVEVKVEAAKESPTYNHNLTITEGGTSRSVTFVLEKNSNRPAGSGDVIRSDLPPPPKSN